MIILAARPGIGKSTLAAQWGIHPLLLQEDPDPVAIFTLEMARQEVWERVHSNVGKFNIRSAIHSRDLYTNIRGKAIPRLAGKPLYIDDMASVSVPYIQAQLSQLVAKTGRRPSLCIIDYVQLMSSPANSRGAQQNEAVRIGEISRGIKLTAKDFGIPIVILAQLNREVEHRQNGRPQLSDLRDSGGLEQDADAVYFIHRKMGKGPDVDESTTELLLAKHRNGPTGECQLMFDGPTFAFSWRERTTGD
jgi:replicative DNA helicase